MNLQRRFRRLFDLRQDQESPEAIDESVRAGTRFGGTNLWVLFFAILVASVGLNVNSTAVIIGAMLISPLMGPIVGIGYGAAVNDLGLIRRALNNLLIFVALSLLTSVAYFAISPLDEPGSELLARTTPNLWDVLIAAFGGAAGMVGLTRRGFNNVVPGVAIATALMPPLCTVGFGLANARWDMAAGAAYLFVINATFIAAATLAVSKLMRLPPLASIDDITRVRNRSLITLALLLVIVPAAWLGWRFAQQEVFVAQARALVQAAAAEGSLGLVSHEIDGAARRVKLVVVGAAAEQQLRDALPLLAARHQVEPQLITVRRVGDGPVATPLAASAQALGQLAGEVGALRAEVAELRKLPPPPVDEQAQLLAEVQAQWPQVTALTLARGQRYLAAAAASAQPAASAPVAAAAAPATPEPQVLVAIELPRALPPGEAQRLQRWLQARLPGAPLRLIEYPQRAR